MKKYRVQQLLSGLRRIGGSNHSMENWPNHEALHKNMIKLEQLGLIEIRKEKRPGHTAKFYFYTIIEDAAEKFRLSFRGLPRNL